MTAKKLLYIIQEQKADIERLNKEIQIGRDAYIMMQTKIAIIKSEAIKEFADRLNEKLCDCNIVSDGEYCGFDCSDVHECVDNLVKEIMNK